MASKKMMPVNAMREQLIDKATTDKAFRERLIADPKNTIREELNVTIPAGFDVEVLEDGATKGYLVLPPSAELNEADLQQAAGGTSKVVYFWALVTGAIDS